MTRTLALILTITVLGGCAATTGGDAAARPVEGSVAMAATSMPRDWSLDATVLAGRNAPKVAPAHLRPSRYTVFPDGSLHYADATEDDYRRGTAWLPPRTRTLPASELESIWLLARDLGLTDPTAGEAPTNLDLIRPPAEGLVIVIAVAAADVRRMFVYGSDGERPHDDAARLVRHLATLAWATDLTEEPALIEPKRYDLGPDPYARYRNR